MLQRTILQFCDPSAADTNEGKFLAMIVAEAYADLGREDGTHKMSAKRFFDDGTARPFCDLIGFAWETALAWRNKYG